MAAEDEKLTWRKWFRSYHAVLLAGCIISLSLLIGGLAADDLLTVLAGALVLALTLILDRRASRKSPPR